MNPAAPVTATTGAPTGIAAAVIARAYSADLTSRGVEWYE